MTSAAPPPSTAPPAPVTVVVSRRILPGREAEYEAWVRGISEEAMRFPGSLGIRILRPPDASHAEHEAVYFFTTREHLDVWLNSTQRQEWLRRAEPFTEGASDHRIVTGLEYFFVPPGVKIGFSETPKPPPAWKQAAVVLLAVYPSTMLVSALLHPIVADWPYWLSGLLRSICIVLLMTFAAMPMLTRLLSPWLYRRANP